MYLTSKETIWGKDLQYRGVLDYVFLLSQFGEYVYGILIAQSNEFAIWKSDVRAASTVYRCLEASQTKDDIFTPLKQA